MIILAARMLKKEKIHMMQTMKRSKEEIEARKEELIYELLKQKEMKVTDIALLFNCSKRSVYNYINELKPYVDHLNGGIVRINALESENMLIEKWTEQHTIIEYSMEKKTIIAEFLKEKLKINLDQDK